MNSLIVRLHVSWAATSAGTWAFSLLLALYAYREGGAGAVGVAAMVRMLPSAFAASYTAMLADRHSRRAVLLGATLARAALLAAVALAVALDAPLPAVLALAAALTAVGTAGKPAQIALLPHLARTPGELAAANVAWSSIDNLGFLLGVLLAGALAALVSLPGALALTALLFLVAAALLSALPADTRPQALPAERKGELLAGFRTVALARDLRLLVGLNGALVLTMAILDVLLVVVALEDFDMGPSGAGWLSAAWGVGSIGGGIVALTLVRSGHLTGAVARGALLVGVPVSAMGLWAQAGPALALLTVAGAGIGLLEIAVMTLTQRLAGDDVLARVCGVQETVGVVATAVGSVLAAALIAVFGGAGALIATGVILPLAALVIAPRLRASEARMPVPEQAFTLLRALPMFAPLPLATVENLALRACRADFAPGEPIILAGELGSYFYVLERGNVAVSRDGAVVAERHAGDFFGEIALVRDVPRTATVTATTPVTTLAIARDEFLAAIGACPRSGHETERVVAERLLRDREAHGGYRAKRAQSGSEALVGLGA